MHLCSLTWLKVLQHDHHEQHYQLYECIECRTSVQAYNTGGYPSYPRRIAVTIDLDPCHAFLYICILGCEFKLKQQSQSRAFTHNLIGLLA